METDFAKQALFSLIRFASAPLAAWAVDHFQVSSDNANAFIVGGLTYGTMFVWSLFNKWRAEKKITTALELPAGASRKTLEVVVDSK